MLTDQCPAKPVSVRTIRYQMFAGDRVERAEQKDRALVVDGNIGDLDFSFSAHMISGKISPWFPREFPGFVLSLTRDRVPG